MQEKSSSRHLATLTGALALVSCAIAAAPIALTVSESTALRQFTSAAPKDNQARPIDLSDPVQEAAYRAILRLNGLTSANRPQLYRSLEEIKARHQAARANGVALAGPANPAADVPANAFRVLNLGTNDWKTISSVAYGTVYGGMSSATITVTVHDSSENVMGGSTEDWQGSLEVSAGSGDLKNTTEGPVTSLGTFSGVANNGESIGPLYFTIDGGYYPKQINNLKPSLVNNTGDPVVVCLNRKNPDSRNPKACDYGPTMPDWKGGDPIFLKIPIAGSIQYNGSIDIDKSTGKPTKPSVSVWLTGQTVGGACSARKLDTKSFIDNAKISATAVANDTISWDLEYADFGTVCWQNNEMYTLTLQLTLSVAGKAVVATITNYPGTQQKVSTLVSRPLQMQWGCIVEGTPVLMADGTNVPIERVKMGNRVAGANGPLEVRSTTLGWDHEVMIVGAGPDTKVAMTAKHPVPTGRGMIQAEKLRIGDTLTTRSGPATVDRLSTEQRKEPVKVYNLELGQIDGPPPADPAQATFYAGGILVGDSEMQRLLMKPQVPVGELRERIRPEWLEDFDNWAQEQAQKEATP